MTLTQPSWLAVAARTGRQLDFLPGARPGDVLAATLGRPDNLTVKVPLAFAPKDWRRATRPWATNLVAVVDDKPVHGVQIIDRHVHRGADAEASWVELTCQTLESYFDRRYVGTVSYRNVAQDLIVADLAGRFARDGGSGLPGIRLLIDAGSFTARPRVRNYLDADDKTLLSVLDDLAGVDGGIEWTVRWVRLDLPSPEWVPVLRVASKIGVDPRDQGLQPITFELPGCVLEADEYESWAPGKGANRVTATGQKSGDDRAQVTVDDLTDTDLPLAELREQVSSSNSDDADDGSLADHARAALAVTAAGGTALTLTASMATAPQLGTEWGLGDTIAVRLAAITIPNPADPDGEDVVVVPEHVSVHRCIGWQWNLQKETITPILWVPDGDL